MPLAGDSRPGGRPPLAWVAAGLIVASAPAGARAQDGERLARATRTVVAPRIDGLLNDEVWATATPIGPLVQVEPKEGAEPTEATEVRFLYDDDHLYIGIRCHDGEPDEIITTTRLRDALLDSDDTIEILLDTFRDRRTAFYFEVNPGGTKVDALVTDNGDDFNQAWDGIWEAKTRIDSEGWSVEIALPFKTLTFREGLETWGLNVRRFVGRKEEYDHWTGASQDYGFTNPVHAGDLTGLAGVRQGLGLDVVPFLAVRHENDRELGEHDSELKPGLDAFLRVTPSLKLSVTVNTDFSDTDIDEAQINLTRFPLLFPEQRDFFVQDSGFFEFPSSGVIPFFSRRIGILDGQEVPILTGVKLSGRAGPYNVGLLDVVTDDAEIIDEDGDEVDVDRQNLTVARVSRNVGVQSNVGAIFTAGNPREDLDGTGRNSLFGMDATYRTSDLWDGKNLQAQVWALKSDSSDVSGDDMAFGASLSYPNDVWSWNVDVFQIQENFDPALGFVFREDVKTYAAGLFFDPRGEGELVRQWSYGLEAEIVTDNDDDLETWEVVLTPLEIEFESGDELSTSIDFTHEALDEDFEVSDGVVIPVDDYDFVDASVGYQSSTRRELSFDAALGFGGFYDGDILSYSFGLEWRPGPLFTGGLDFGQNDVDLPGGDFSTQIALLSTEFTFTPELSWNTFAQWDNESDELDLNAQILWIIEPGRELSFVFNESWETRDGQTESLSRDVSLKLSYTIRF